MGQGAVTANAFEASCCLGGTGGGVGGAEAEAVGTAQARTGPTRDQRVRDSGGTQFLFCSSAQASPCGKQRHRGSRERPQGSSSDGREGGSCAS